MNKTEGDVTFTLVHPRFLDNCWIDAGRFLRRATDRSHGRFDIFSLRRQIEAGASHLWILFQGDDEMLLAATTEIAFYPLRKNLSVTFMGGDDSGLWYDYRDLIVEVFEDFARANECDGIELTGRDGWLKVLAKFGFEKVFTVVEKDLRSK